MVLLSCFTLFRGLLVDSLNYAFASGTPSPTKVTLCPLWPVKPGTFTGVNW